MTTRDKARAGTIAWVDLQTPDPPRARSFYSKLLGWSFVGGEDAQTGFYTMAQLGGRNAAGMAQLSEGSPFPPMWSVYFATDSADDTARLVAEAGGQVVVAPMDVMDEGRMAYFADPTGAHFGVWQGKNHQGAQVVEEPGAMVWHEAYTRDGARACDFYGAVFRLEARPVDVPSMKYWTLHLGDTVVAGVMEMNETMPADIPPHWHTYFQVTSADQAVETLREMGGGVIEAPFDTPYGRIAVATDPFGAPFNLLQPPA